jgi:dTDP-4-dehydrorhamnose 3,5-epimerase
MKFTETPLEGAFILDLEPFGDERGIFARAFCRNEFEGHGLNPEVAQSNLSVSKRKGTIRGLHYQLPPAAETKLVRCTRGAIYDVIVDMRPDSPTYLEHFGLELSAENGRALYVPRMFAHGCQSLVDDTEIHYLVSEFYTPGHERGLRYDDPELGIQWPAPVSLVSEKDSSWPFLKEAGRT